MRANPFAGKHLGGLVVSQFESETEEFGLGAHVLAFLEPNDRFRLPEFDSVRATRFRVVG